MTESMSYEAKLLNEVSTLELENTTLENAINALRLSHAKQTKKGKKGWITRKINKALDKQYKNHKKIAEIRKELADMAELDELIERFNAEVALLDEHIHMLEAQEFLPKIREVGELYASGKTTDAIIQDFVDMGFNNNDAGLLTSKYLLTDFTQSFEEFIGEESTKTHTIDKEKFFDDIRNDGIFEIGADFEGILEIEEVDTTDVYVPSSYYCALKCYEKYFANDPRWDGPRHDRKTLCAYKNTPSELKKYMKKLGFEQEILPRFARYDHKNGKFVLLDNRHKSTATATIILVKLKGDAYHAVLLRSLLYNKFDNAHYRSLLNFVVNKVIGDDQIYIREYKPKIPCRYVFAYDIETVTEIRESEVNKNNKQKRHMQTERHLLPYAVAYKLVDLDGPTDDSNVHTFVGFDCLEKMIKHLFLSYPEHDEYIIYAHNGGRFDHLRMKEVKSLKFKTQITSGGSIKSLDAHYTADEKKRTIRFLDSIAFTQLSLDESCKALRCTNRKMDFDIIDRTPEFFDTTNEWKSYLEKDITCLAELLQKFEQSLKKFGESMTRNCGIASIAWRIMHKTCTHMGNMYRAKDPCAKKFIRASCHGGRVIHWKRKYESQLSDGLVSLDGTSLYPSAMLLGRYPVGKFTVLNDLSVGNIHRMLNEGVLFIAEVDLDAGNVRYPIVPYKTDTGMLMYPAGKFTGVYNSVDLLEARSMGYEISNVQRGIYWNRSANVFSQLITCMFNERKQYKKEGNSMEYTLKILLNAMYGKFLELVKSGFKFQDTALNDDAVQLNNGQYVNEFKYAHPIENKPTQIGSFILAYARSIVNNLIMKVGPENIYYGDTDSIYIPHSIIKERGIELRDELGHFKNDYGDGKLITYAIFLDVKRYYLELNDGSFKCKFNGYSFKQKGSYASHLKDEAKRDEVRKLFESFANTGTTTEQMFAEKWIRLDTSVMIVKKELKFQVNPSNRADWREGCSTNGLIEYYPKGYDMNKPERLVEYHTNAIDFCKSQPMSEQYYLSRNGGLKSALPLVADEQIKVNISRLQVKNFRFSFIESNGVVYQKTARRDKEGKDEVHYYEVCDYGPVREIEKEAWQNFKLMEKGVVALKKPDRLTPSSFMDKEQTDQLLRDLRTVLS